MSRPNARLSAVLFVTVLAFWATGEVWGIGFILGATKDELKLKYDLEVQDHGTGRVTIVFTLADEGRLTPLDAVLLVIPEEGKQADGSKSVDLSVSIDMSETDNGKRIGRIHILKSLAERAEISLDTHKLDGKVEPLTHYHHRIRISEYLKNTASKETAPGKDRPKN